jgi:hypothetical protein
MFMLDLPKGTKDESLPMLIEPIGRILDAKVGVAEHKD